MCLVEQGRDCDGCITEDGDTLLYGARVICKDLGISSKDPRVYYYNREDIESSFDKDMAMKLLLAPQGDDILERFRKKEVHDLQSDGCQI